MINDKMHKVDWALIRVLESPHILVAGTTGSGKSVLLNALLYSLLKRHMSGFLSGDTVDLYLADTKRVELKAYADWPIFTYRVTEPEDVCTMLDFAIECMEGVYWRMEQAGLRETNEPHSYIVIDELADVVSQRGVLDRLVKIGRLGRAAHFHLLCCTQDPSRHTLSAQLMQNFTIRIALRCKDAIESRQIIGEPRAELIDRYGFALLQENGRVYNLEFDAVPDADIINLVQSCHKGYEWKKYMSSKPTFKERLFNTRAKYADYLYREVIDRDYAEKLSLRKALL